MPFLAICEVFFDQFLFDTLRATCLSASIREVLAPPCFNGVHAGQTYCTTLMDSYRSPFQPFPLSLLHSLPVASKEVWGYVKQPIFGKCFRTSMPFDM